MIRNIKRVLVVDDDERVRFCLAEYLVSHQFAVVTVTDGLQALRELHRQQFDALITDLYVPYFDGFDLLCQCHLVWPELPVILMSGNLLDIVGPAMAHGAYACLPKPVDAGKLIHVLSEAIARPVLPTETTRLNRDLLRSPGERRLSHAYHRISSDEYVVERVHDRPDVSTSDYE